MAVRVAQSAFLIQITLPAQLISRKQKVASECHPAGDEHSTRGFGGPIPKPLAPKSPFSSLMKVLKVKNRKTAESSGNGFELIWARYKTTQQVWLW